AVYDMNDPKTWGDWNTVTAFVRTLKELDAPSVDEEKSPLATQSGDDGAFLLEDSEPGNYEVAARPEPPRIGARAYVAGTLPKPEARVRLAVIAGSRLVGRVVDAEEKGVDAV